MCNNVHEWSVPGCPDPSPGPWPALISDESQLCIRSREKMHKYPNKHEEKSLENANVRPRSAFLRRYLMNESRTQENECPAEQCLLRCHHWCSGFHLIKCHMSPCCDIIPDLWLVNHPSYSPLIGRDSRVAWVTVSISRIVISCHSAQLSGRQFIASHPHLCSDSCNTYI